MAKFSYIVNDLSAGEVHPRSYGRTDVQGYRKGCKRLENAIPYIQGGGGRRPGTQFVASHYYNTQTVAHTAFADPMILIPFIRTRGITNPQPHMIVIRGGSNISPDATSTDIAHYSFQTTAALGASTSTAPNSNASMADIKWIETYAGVSNFPGRLPAWTAPSATNLPLLQWAQIGDTLVIVSETEPPLFITSIDTGNNPGTQVFVAYPFYARPQLVRDPSTASKFIVDSVLLQRNSWPFRDLNTNSAHTLDPSATTGSAITVVSSKDFFAPGHVGAFFKIQGGSFQITSVVDPQNAVADVVDNLSSHAATADWNESSWSDYRGWPRTVALFQDRLIYGGNTSQPDTLWASQVGDYQEHEVVTSPTASDAWIATIASTDGAPIAWMSPGKNLNIGTESSEWIMSAPDGGTVSTVSLNIRFDKESAAGSWAVVPVRNGNAVTFVERDARTLREFVFNFQEDSFRSDSLSAANNHLIEKMHKLVEQTDPMPRFTTKCLAFQGGEFPTIWATDNWGGLWGISRDRATGAVAGHWHKLGGESGDNPPYVNWVATSPSPWFGHDDVYVVVRRTINAGTVYYIEKIGEPYRFNDVFTDDRTYDSNHICYADGARVRIGSSATSITGFWQLRGQTVDVVADGKYVGQKTVGTDTSGTITLDNAAEVVVAGLSYRSIIQPLSVEAGSVVGSSLHQIKRIDRVIIKFVRAVFAMFGRDEDNLERIIFRENSLPMGDETPFFEGLKDLELQSVYGRDGDFMVVTDHPFPMDVSSITARGTTYD